MVSLEQQLVKDIEQIDLACVREVQHGAFASTFRFKVCTAFRWNNMGSLECEWDIQDALPATGLLLECTYCSCTLPSG